jgi:PAS domain S-box-containing protein
MRRFRDLFEQSPIGVAIYDTSGDLLIVNSAYLRALGTVSFSTISERNLFKDPFLTPQQRQTVKDGKVLQYETEIDFTSFGGTSTREGTAYFMSTVSPISREDELVGHMVLFQDITERKRIEEAQRLAQLGRLLSDMAHEVNNPLMVISGQSELALLRGVEDDKLKATLRSILDQCFFAKDIIQRLLKYSRLGKVKKESMDIQGTIKLILDILRHHFRISNIKVITEFKKALPFVEANEKQLQEVFINILRNSSDAMPDGGDIRIKTANTRKFVKVEITDSGEGMPQKVIDRIFEPFFTTKQKGTGLGLPVCHTIIQEHGGELKFRSVQGKGTTATILLPYQAK